MPCGLASYGFTSSSSSSVASASEINTDCSAAAADNDCSTATAAGAGSSNVKRRKPLALKYKPEWKQRCCVSLHNPSLYYDNEKH